jgi:hypothetical protein
MKERIDIIVPEWILELNGEKRARIEKTHRFEPTDRVPVLAEVQLWGMLVGRGSTFGEMNRNPRDHLRGLILNYKWRCENIRDDMPIDLATITVEQNFGALRGIEFPLEVVFSGDDQPKTMHLLHSPEEIDALAVPHPVGGYNELRVEWYKEMSARVDDFDVRLNGEPLELKVTINHRGGPIPSAFALCGSNLFLWMKTDPARVHRLMEIVTTSHEQCIAYIDELKGATPNHALWLGADTGEMINAAMFKEFVVPYYARLYSGFPYPRIFHMCGKIDHILDLLRDDLNITFLDGFGFPTDRRLLAEKLAGRVVMRGGPHPLLIYEGPRERIIEECSDYIKTVGGKGGYILSDGNGIMPGTPPEHIDAMVAASKQVGWIGGSKSESIGSTASLHDGDIRHDQ